jgi:DNA-binding CsgD family transcriptional regulator
MIELTSRELEVLKLTVDGYTKAQIGDLLRISESTVKTHMYHVFQKLGAKNAPHAVWQALRLGILEPPVSVGTEISPSVEQPLPQFASKAR